MEQQASSDLTTARMQHAVQKYAQALMRIEDTERERDSAYRERAHLVALLAAMTDGAVIAPASDVDEPGWQIVYLRLGGRQASWHIAPRDVDLFAHVERVEPGDPRARWDGHTTEQKYERIAEHARALADGSAEPGLRKEVTALRDDLLGVTGARWIADSLTSTLDSTA